MIAITRSAGRRNRYAVLVGLDRRHHERRDEPLAGAIGTAFAVMVVPSSYLSA